jgi:hypothetical protein
MGCCCILSLNTKSKPSNLNLTSPPPLAVLTLRFKGVVRGDRIEKQSAMAAKEGQFVWLGLVGGMLEAL